MTRSTHKKISYAFITPSAIALVALCVFNWFMLETKQDNVYVHAAGLQHKLTDTLLILSKMVYTGQDEDKAELVAAVKLFNEILDVFEYGGEFMGRHLPKLPHELSNEITDINNIWGTVEPNIDSIIEEHSRSIDIEAAYNNIAQGLPLLSKTSHNLIMALERRSESLRSNMLYTLFAVVFLTIISAITGVWMVRRYTNEQLITEHQLRNEKKEQEKLINQLQDAHTQLLQSEKLASIGQLAAGVAHEINNPVGYVNSNISSLEHAIQDLFRLLTRYEEAEEKLNDEVTKTSINSLKKEIDLEFLKDDLTCLLTESQEGITRVKQIVQDLKDFAHMEEAEWQWADLHKGLNSTLNIVNNEIKYKADVIKEYGEIPNVECIISQLNQVFMNLLVNAAHAIDNHGTITIRTEFADKYVLITIKDTGKGIEPEIINKIFDPFFTTKGVGCGTGLGLSLSYSIINNHKGTIKVDSTPGVGTSFLIKLPITQTKKQAES